MTGSGIRGQQIRVIDTHLDIDEIAVPGNPSANTARFYCADDGGVTKLYYKRSDGTIIELGAVNGGNGGGGSNPVFFIDGALVVATEVGGAWICPAASTINFVYIYCEDPGTASSTIVDVNKNGTTIFTTQANRPSLAWNDADGVAKSGTPDVTSLAENDVLTADIDQAATGAAGLSVLVSINVTPPDLWAIIQAAQLSNEIMNFPSMEQADGAQPEWWEVSANATLTEEDVAGEGITETFERCLKVVTTADNAYAYQRYTYADQPRTKSGRALSVLIAVWSVSSVTARIRLQSSVGSLDVTTTTAAAWTILKLEGAALDGTYVDLRFGVDTGTAYFVPLGLCIGGKAIPLAPRGLVYRHKDTGTQLVNLGGKGDEDTWTDLDCAAGSSNLACMAKCTSFLLNAVSSQFRLYVRRNGSATAKDDSSRLIYLDGALNDEYQGRWFEVLLDDGQIFEYNLDRTSGADNIEYGGINLIGWWEWA